VSRWWRAYDEAVDDPKLILLGDKAHRAWFNLMCVASLHEGVLPDIKIVAVKLRLPPQRAAAALAELVAAGLFDRREDGRFEPHNWNGRQYKSDVTDPTNATRQQRYRDRHRVTENTVTEGVTVTPPREQNTEAEKNAAPAAPDAEVDLFRRGKEVLGKSAGGLIKQLLTAKDGKTNLARAAIEQAAGKENPREYVGKIIRNQEPQPGQVSHYVDGRL